MYTRSEAARIKQEFWTAFGQYLALHQSSEGLKVNWVNYKTGLKDLYFRMEAGKDSATIAIEITHKDLEMQQLVYERFLELKNIFTDVAGNDWTWAMHSEDEFGKIICRIYKEKAGVNIYSKETWPEIISFLKPAIIALDEFWNDVKYGFDEFR